MQISFDNVSYSYPDTTDFSGGSRVTAATFALKEINLSIEKGEFLAVMGKNGSGKTTLCKLINGIIPHITEGNLTGTVTVDGVSTQDSLVPFLSSIAGLVLDDPDAQLFTSSVCNEAAFGPENLLGSTSEIKQRVEDALFAVGLAGFENRHPLTLSGGEKQRLVIASFLTMKNKILVLDEPLSRLDPQGANQVMFVLKEINEKYGITIIITSHESNLINKFANKVCVLNEGRIVECDTAKKIFSNTALLKENGIESPEEFDIQSFFELASRSSQLNTNNSIIEIKNLSFSYDRISVISNLNLAINNNDFAAIIGHNGCGKTTLLKNITGLLKPKNGEIIINGKNISKMTVSDISKEIGFVMQNPDNQLFTDSVYKEVSFALKNMGLSDTEIRMRAEEALNAVGLCNDHVFPHALNRQDRTKVVIAAIIAMGCKTLIFDEVDVGQDYNDCTNIMNLANDLHQKGYTILFVTHNLSLVCRYAHRLIVMGKNGTISEWSRKKK